MKNKRFLHTHPYTIYIYLSKFLFLLIIPILQVLINWNEGVFDVIKSMLINIIFALVLIAYSIIRYHNEGYYFRKNVLYIKRGFFTKKVKAIKSRNIDALTVKQNFLSSLLFGVCSFFADVPSKSRSTDTTIFIGLKSANTLIKRLAGRLNNDFMYRANNLKICFMAALWSNSVTGFLIIAPFFNKMGKILGENFTDNMYNTVDLSYYFIYAGLPPLAATIANILLICWAISFIVQLNRYINFKAFVCNRFLVIKRGFINKVLFITEPSSVNALIIKQSIFMVPFGLYSVFINTISTEKTKDDKSLLVAAEKRQKLFEYTKRLLPNYNLTFSHELHPRQGSFKSYLYFPLSVLALDIIPAIMLFFSKRYESLLYLILIFSLPFIALFILFRIIAFKRISLSFNNSTLKAVNFRRFTVCENYIPLNKVQKTVIRQTPFQRIAGRCNFSIYTFSENNLHFTVKHLSLDECIEFNNTLLDNIK